MKLIFGEKRFARKRGNPNLWGSDVAITGWECRQLEGNQHAQQTSQNSCLKVSDGSAPWRCQFFEDPSGVHTSLSWWIWGHSWPLPSIRELFDGLLIKDFAESVVSSVRIVFCRLFIHGGQQWLFSGGSCRSLCVWRIKKKLFNDNENWA